MPPLNPYDSLFIRRQRALTRRILSHFEDGIILLTPTLSTLKWKGVPFRISDYPALQKKVDQVAAELQNKIYTTTVNGIRESWDLSNKKNDVFVDKRVAGKRMKKSVRQALYDPNAKALESFIARKEKGMDLSKRVWKAVDPFKKEIEQTVGIGVGKGQSAQEMARELKRNLNEPDRLFRRVRGEDGKLYLSQSARNYHPGQGVYRSSFKNSMRVARTETNGSYRTADHERWKTLPFVKGIEIKLSSAHPKVDICDKLVGLYPKDFKFQGWHPQCLCFATPEIMSDEEYDNIEDQLLAGLPITVPAKQLIQAPPPAFGKYLVDNKEMLGRLKSEPYWMRDNPQYLNSKSVVKAKDPFEIPKELKSKVNITSTGLESILKKYGVSEDAIINLAGGIPKSEFSFYNITIRGLGEDVVGINMDSSLGEVSRRIDFKDKVIDNLLMKMKKGERGGGVGTSYFFTEVKTARELGFTKMDVSAAGDPGSKEWDGFERWGRFGYTQNKYYHERFLRLMQQNNRTEKTLAELCLDDEGYKFWKENGWPWDGVFDLTDGSVNMKHVEAYIKKKKLNIDLGKFPK